ncbi:CRISPR-associated protein TM1801 [Methylobacterium nodulans ORS 2060]|uniref:CRISPR-associated protein TM1801 n=1 Tax=Methylobacterium nodulans (strain LMG 21967 / CNCM I-2342 / ORS 2060) TaxID=460265 RepID=B8IFB4_METNO|nr:CRISPR-associated protein TM1801 [Methylobacterium nodulans ORS 2060]
MTDFNRGSGLLIIEVKNSNPNGDPDAESEPRTLDTDGRGLISPVSFKRKLRDLAAEKSGPVWAAASSSLMLGANGRGFDILEARGRDRKSIAALDIEAMKNKFWDGRLFGNTFIEEGDKGKFITTGAVQFGPGISVAPIEVTRLTLTNKAGVEGDKDRGMAPLAWRAVVHAVYVMPFFVNPTAAQRSGCDERDIDLLKFLIPHAYPHTASAIQPFVEMLHAWYAEHKSPLGSCPDSLIINAMTPRRKGDPNEPSRSIEDYDIPTELPPEIRSRLASFEDLCTKSWG